MALAWLDLTEGDSSYDEPTAIGNPEGECIWIDDWPHRSVSRDHFHQSRTDDLAGNSESTSEYNDDLGDESDSRLATQLLDDALTRLSAEVLTLANSMSGETSSKFTDAAFGIIQQSLGTIRELAQGTSTDTTNGLRPQLAPVEVDWRRINQEALARSNAGVERFDEDGIPLPFASNLRIDQGLLEADDPEVPYSS